MKKTLVTVCVLLLSSVLFSETWDLDLDFENATVNPNGAWSYGYIDGSGFALLTDGVFDPDNGSARYCWRYAADDWDTHGNIQKILEGEADFEDYNSYRYGGEMCSGPGEAEGVRTAIRWTCPATGNYSVSAMWQGLSTKSGGTTVDVTLELNGTAIFTNYVAGFIGRPGEEATGTQPEVGYDAVLSLAEGDTLDITIAGGTDGISSDCTNMDLEIAKASAPSTPTCDDLVTMGSGYFSMDFNRDCYVNLEDFAEFALDWLKCNDPVDLDCID